MSFTNEIEEVIREVLPDAIVEVTDPMGDGAHLEAVVVSEQFKGLSLIKQHQLVMNALSDHFSESLHALKLKTCTPDKWSGKSS